MKRVRIHRIISLMLVLVMMIPFFPTVSIGGTTEETSCKITVYGGKVTNAQTGEEVLNPVAPGTILLVSFTEKMFEGYEFSHFQGVHGDIVPEKTFRIALNSDACYYPVFKNYKPSYGEWQVVEKYEDCEMGILEMREDSVSKIREYRITGQKPHHFVSFEGQNGNQHLSYCDVCKKKVLQHHEYSNEYSPYSEAYHKRTCTKCGYVHYSEHNFIKGEIVKEPTHTEEGAELYICRDCGMTVQKPIVPTSEHHYTERVVTVPSVNGQIGKCKYRCSCGALTEEYYYLDVDVKSYIQNAYVFLDSHRSDIATHTCHNEKYFHYTNNEGHETYIYAVHPDFQDYDQTFALMFIDDPALKAKPVYIAKSDSSNGIYGYNWSYFDYVKDLDGFLMSMQKFDSYISRNSQLVRSITSWSERYNEMRIPASSPNTDPSSSYYTKKEESFFGKPAVTYSVFYQGSLLEKYYIDPETGATLSYTNYSNNIYQGFNIHRRPMVENGEYEKLTAEEQDLYSCTNKIVEEIANISNSSSLYSLNISLDAPKNVNMYRVRLDHYNDYFEYDRGDRNTMKDYMENVVYGFTDSISSVGITLYFSTVGGIYSFGGWERYDFENEKWVFFSNEENYRFNISKETAVTEALYIRAIRLKNENETEKKYTVNVENGYYADGKGIRKSEGTVKDGEKISFTATRIPEGKMLDHWEISVDGGTPAPMTSWQYEVHGNIFVKPVFTERKAKVYTDIQGKNGQVQINGGTFGEYQSYNGEVGTQITLSAKGNEGFQVFLGWFEVDYGKGNATYRLISEKENFTYTIHERSQSLVARYGNGKPEPSFDVFFVNVLGGSYYGNLKSSHREPVSEPYGADLDFRLIMDAGVQGEPVKMRIVKEKPDGTILTEEQGVKEFFYNNEMSLYIHVDMVNGQFEFVKITVTVEMAEPVPHIWDEGTITKAPTHSEEGEMIFHCSHCAETKTVVLPRLLQHEFSDWQKVDDRLHGKTCSCGEKVVEEHHFNSEGICVDCGAVKKAPGKIVQKTDPQKNEMNGNISEKLPILKKAVFNKNDLERIENGGENAEISVKVQNIDKTVTPEIQNLVKDALQKEQVAHYLDINLFKKVGAESDTKIAKLNAPVALSVTVPSEWLAPEGTDFIYQLVRIHDGKAEKILGKFDYKSRTLEFETDRFSTYALVYSEVEEGDVNMDNNTSIADVTAQLNFLSASAEQQNLIIENRELSIKNLDADADGLYSISDVTRLLNILSK